MDSSKMEASTAMMVSAVFASAVCFPRSRSTGKERDAETGLANGNDYFGARYYSSAMGRFLSPDWSAKIEPVPYVKLDDPQTLNLFTYVGNNPLTRSDADGHVGAGSGCHQGKAKCDAAIQKSNADLDKKVKKLEAAHPRAALAANGVLKLAVAGVKAGIAAGAIAAAPETAGASLLGAGYLAVGATGSFTEGVTDLAGAAFGDSKDLGEIADAGEAASTLTTGAGLTTAIVTGGDMKAASKAATAEGIATMKPGELFKGPALLRVGNAIDQGSTVKDAVDASK
jgi:RHS repeat-associated protein